MTTCDQSGPGARAEARKGLFDRDKAREILRAAGVIVDEPMTSAVERVLDRLEECVRLFAWQNLEDLLAEHYPEDIFPVRADDPSVDPGPRILALARLLHRSEAKLARIAALCEEAERGTLTLAGETYASARTSLIRAVLDGGTA
jgi:hypothetical protein